MQKNPLSLFRILMLSAMNGLFFNYLETSVPRNLYKPVEFMQRPKPDLLFLVVMLLTITGTTAVHRRALQVPTPSNSNGTSTVGLAQDPKDGDVDVHAAAGVPYWCTYSLEVETTCALFGGTDDTVSVRFGDKSGRHVTVDRLVSKGKKDFERCHLDTFRIRGPCLSNVCSLSLKRSGHDDWRPGWARVFYGGAHSPTFTFRKFIPSGVWYGFDYC